MNGTPLPNGVRLCLRDHEGIVRKIARLDWSNRDASLYITAYCPPGGRSFAGRFDMPPGVDSFTFDPTGQLEAGDIMPKMSLHESGLTKTEVAGKKTKFVTGQPIFHAAGGHVATIKTNKPDTLPVLTKKAKSGQYDLKAEGGAEPWTSVRFPVSVHASPDDNLVHRFQIVFQRPHLPTPVYVGIDIFGEYEPQNDADGVSVIGGWGPAMRPSQVSEVAFIGTRVTPDTSTASA
jgi:hypothetical protein